ncbi:hypothetical protein [Salinimonas iocasae]|uniref:Uncharacterized protein n=1 Tax=Salinimonas iocasae TaxID=2572577 RepID=A0A5B7YJ38_9ALTE|nr:hypothetical protein [Salinimonas iocasae]QCZ95538.1 hypothetical protein FBQ74_18635 [Salinimonas iocasae]
MTGITFDVRSPCLNDGKRELVVKLAALMGYWIAGMLMLIDAKSLAGALFWPCLIIYIWWEYLCVPGGIRTVLFIVLNTYAGMRDISP